MAGLLAHLEPRVGDFLADLATLVGIDSGSGNAAGVTAVGDWCAARLAALGLEVEQIGSPGGRAMLEDVAAGSDVVLALECARENGDLVSARSGVGDAVVTVLGRAAHAGIEPERGLHAVLAAAELTVALQQLNRPAESVTVNVGVIQGGSRPNVVPERARLEVDVRATTIAAFEAARRAVEASVAAACTNGVRASVDWREVTPPMETTPGWLLELASRAGDEVGVAVCHAATGGVGDANLTAGMGIPTLDGLGPIGGNDHSPAEYLEVSSIAPRVAMLATLVSMLASPGALVR